MEATQPTGKTHTLSKDTPDAGRLVVALVENEMWDSQGNLRRHCKQMLAKQIYELLNGKGNQEGLWGLQVRDKFIPSYLLSRRASRPTCKRGFQNCAQASLQHARELGSKTCARKCLCFTGAKLASPGHWRRSLQVGSSSAGSSHRVPCP